MTEQPPRATGRTTLLLAAWCIPATIAVLQQATSYIMRGELSTEWPWALFQFPKWLSWFLVTPLVLRLVDWQPIERRDERNRLARAVAIHVVAAITIVVLFEVIWLGPSMLLEHLTGGGTTMMLVGGVLKRGRMTMSSRFLNTILPRVMSGVVTYMAVAGLAMTMRASARLRDRETASARLEAELAVAQVQALKMQVHPHFLFNTLHAVTVLIREDQDAAVRTVTQLGDLLRTTLSRAACMEVALQQEIETLQLFLEIEATRFEDRLRIRYDIDTGVTNASVPDLILQPLVENAIRHGIERRAGPGTIEVRAAVAEGRLVLQVTDDGVGISEHNQITEGIGLATTRARLTRLYGNDHEFSLTQTPGSGCTATIVIPLRQHV